MKTTEQCKHDLMDDLYLCISYEPSRENDILCMMERYLKCEKERPTILENLHNLLDDKPYQNPYAVYYFYGKTEIQALESLLTDYLSQTVDEGMLRRTIAQINALHCQCGGELIDQWRSSMLEEFLLLGADTLPSACSIIHDAKQW